MSMKSLLTFINPASGKKKDKSDIPDFLHNHFHNDDNQLFELKKGTSKSEIEEKIKSQSWDGVIISGGDGTVKLIGECLAGTDIPAVILPMGSANGLATCLGIYELDDAISAFKRGKIIHLDKLDVNGESCFHLCDFGFNAGLIKRFHDEDERGMVSYFKASLRQFFDVRPYRFELKTRDSHWEAEAKMLVVANGDKFGTGAVINPKGKLDDGRMEVICLNPESFEDLAALSLHLFRGTLHESDLAKIWSVKEIEIINSDEAEFHIDGEVKETTRNVNISCLSKQVKFYSLRGLKAQ